MTRVLPAARLRLGMRVAWGGEVTELHRPDRSTVKRGYGRVRVAYSDGQSWAHYPSDPVVLAKGEDAPADPSMDGWPGRWWPAGEWDSSEPEGCGQAWRREREAS